MVWQSFSAHRKYGGKSEGKYSGPRVLLEMLFSPCPAFGGLIGEVASPLKLFFLSVSVSLFLSQGFHVRVILHPNSGILVITYSLKDKKSVDQGLSHQMSGLEGGHRVEPCWGAGAEGSSSPGSLYPAFGLTFLVPVWLGCSSETLLPLPFCVF